MILYMKQKVFSWRDRFFVKDEAERDCYYVEGELWSWGKKLHVYDMEGRELAFIQQKLWSWMPTYFVEIQGREVCRIVKKWTFIRPKYEIQGLGWQVEGNFMAHEYCVTDRERLVMEIYKHWFTWGDSYALDIAQDGDALLCLCVVLAIDATLEQEASAAASH